MLSYRLALLYFQQMSPFSMQELCESIVSMAFDPVKESRTDALFRTGPGPFTDTILKHAIQHPFSKSPKRTQVRLLPRISLGGLPSDCHWVPMFNEPRRLLKHWGSGSWKSADFEESWTGTRTSKLRALVLMQVPAFAELGELLYPVSTLTKPAFTLMVQLKGHGDKQVAQSFCNCFVKRRLKEWPVAWLSEYKPLLQCITIREGLRSWHAKQKVSGKKGNGSRLAGLIFDQSWHCSKICFAAHLALKDCLLGSRILTLTSF